MASTPKGVPTVSNYPMTNVDQAPQPVKGSLGSSLSYAMLGSSSGVTPRDIEAFMVKYGYPVPVDMAAGAGRFEDYQSGVYDGCVANAAVDHIVAIVGWSNEGTTFGSNGYLPSGEGLLDRQEFLVDPVRRGGLLPYSDDRCERQQV